MASDVDADKKSRRESKGQVSDPVDSTVGNLTSTEGSDEQSDEEEDSVSNEESHVGSETEEMEPLEAPPPGLCTTCGFYTLVVINVFLAIIGFLVLLMGLGLKFGTDHIDYLETMISDIYSKLAKTEKRKLDIDIAPILTAFVNGLIVVGFSLLFLTVAGFSGSLGKTRPALIFYSVVIVFLILAEMVLLVMFRKKMESFVQDTMYSTLKNKYKGNNSTETASLAWNYIMITFQCCGVLNHADFKEALQWNKTITVANKEFVENLPYPVPPETIHLVIPEPCCKVVDKRNITCALIPTDVNSNMNQGCLKAVIKLVSQYYIYVDAVFLAIILLQIILLVSAVILLMTP